MAGNCDTAIHANGFGYYGAYETIRDWCAEYMPEGNFIDGGLVPGSHDIYTWGQCLYYFAKDIVWSKEAQETLTVPDTPATPEVPNTPNTPEVPSQSIKAGDMLNIVPVVTMNMAALVGIVLFVYDRRKYNMK